MWSQPTAAQVRSNHDSLIIRSHHVPPCLTNTTNSAEISEEVDWSLPAWRADHLIVWIRTTELKLASFLGSEDKRIHKMSFIYFFRSDQAKPLKSLSKRTEHEFLLSQKRGKLLRFSLDENHRVAGPHTVSTDWRVQLDWLTDGGWFVLFRVNQHYSTTPHQLYRVCTLSYLTPSSLSSLTSTQAGGDKKISILSLSWEIITRQTITINIAGLIGMSHCRVIDIWVKSHGDMQYLSTQQKILLRLLSQSAARERERERAK